MPMLDPFGKREIYPSNTHPNRAKPWYLGTGDWKDRRYTFGTGDWEHYSTSIENNTLTINFVFDPFPADPRGIKGRFPVLALPAGQYVDSSGEMSVGTEKDQSKLRKRGYMGTPNDWKNAEITMYFKVNSVANSGTRAMAFSVRGGPHHSEGGTFGISPCWGTALYIGLFLVRAGNGDYAYEGSGEIQKELRHGDYTYGIYTEKSVTGGNILNRWIGMKGVFYTKANGNPYIELWLDKNINNKWELILQKEDEEWYIEEIDENGNHWIIDNKCGGRSCEKVTWGGPGVIFKLDGLTRVDMKWASIREILPPEGWPLRYLLNARGVSPTFSMRSLAQEYGLTAPISLRELTEREAERYPFP